MAGASRLDWIDVAVSVPLALAVPAAVVASSEAVIGGAALAILLAPGVLAATALRRSPRDAVQGSLAVATYLSLAALGAGFETATVPEDLGVLGLVALPAFGAALAVRAAFRAARDPTERVTASVGKSRVPGLTGAAGAGGSAVVGVVRRGGDGPVVYPDRPRRRAVVVRLTVLPLLLAVPAGILLVLVVATASPSEPPLYADDGTRAYVLLTFGLSAIHPGATLVRAAVDRWRGEPLDREELRWALLHAGAWAGVWIGVALDSRLLGTPAALAVLATAVKLVLASVAAVRETNPEPRASA